MDSAVCAAVGGLRPNDERDGKDGCHVLHFRVAGWGQATQKARQDCVGDTSLAVTAEGEAAPRLPTCKE